MKKLIADVPFSVRAPWRRVRLLNKPDVSAGTFSSAESPPPSSLPKGPLKQRSRLFDQLQQQELS